MQTCTAQTKNGLPCKMRPASGANLCRNHSTGGAAASAPTALVEISDPLAVARSTPAAAPAASTSSAPASSKATAGELVAGVLAGLAAVAVLAFALFTSSNSTPAPGAA